MKKFEGLLASTMSFLRKRAINFHSRAGESKLLRYNVKRSFVLAALSLRRGQLVR